LSDSYTIRVYPSDTAGITKGGSDEPPNYIFGLILTACSEVLCGNQMVTYLFAS